MVDEILYEHYVTTFDSLVQELDDPGRAATLLDNMPKATVGMHLSSANTPERRFPVLTNKIW